MKASPPDVEALRYYLVLPMHECMSDPANAKEFQIPYADAVLGLQKNAIKVGLKSMVNGFTVITIKTVSSLIEKGKFTFL